MTNEEYQKKIDSILEKVGTESGNLIYDEIGVLLTDNKAMNDEISKKDQEIENLKRMNSTLQNVNGNLLQQVSMGIEKPESPDKKEEKIKDFDFRTAFDEKGNFKRN